MLVFGHRLVLNLVLGLDELNRNEAVEDARVRNALYVTIFLLVERNALIVTFVEVFVGIANKIFTDGGHCLIEVLIEEEAFLIFGFKSAN